MNYLLWILSIPTIAVIGLCLGYFAYRICYGFAASFSCTLWMFRKCKLNGFRSSKYPPWVYFPCEFSRNWVSFTAAKPGSITVSGHGGSWDGIFSHRIWRHRE